MKGKCKFITALHVFFVNSMKTIYIISIHVETVVLLSRQKLYGQIEMDLDDLDTTSTETKVTY